jgi:hypothetical protein
MGFVKVHGSLTSERVNVEVLDRYFIDRVPASRELGHWCYYVVGAAGNARHVIAGPFDEVAICEKVLERLDYAASRDGVVLDLEPTIARAKGQALADKLVRGAAAE